MLHVSCMRNRRAAHIVKTLCISKGVCGCFPSRRCLTSMSVAFYTNCEYEFVARELSGRASNLMCTYADGTPIPERARELVIVDPPSVWWGCSVVGCSTFRQQLPRRKLTSYTSHWSAAILLGIAVHQGCDSLSLSVRRVVCLDLTMNHKVHHN